MNVEVGILLVQLVQLLLEQDVLGVNVGEQEVDLGGIVAAVTGTVTDDSLDDLEHGGDTGTTSDHTNVTAHVGSVDHGTLGAADLHGLADLESGQVLGDVTLGVSLDEQVEVTGLIVGGDRGVGADNLLGLALNGGGEGDVLTDGETEDISGTGQRKAVDGDIVGDVVDLLQLEVLELGRDQDLARLYSGWKWGLVSLQFGSVARSRGRMIMRWTLSGEDQGDRRTYWGYLRRRKRRWKAHRQQRRHRR